MRDKIIQMRETGASYRDIQKELGCSIGTVSYYCGTGQKEKAINRLRKNKRSLNGILKRKKDNFSFSNGNRKRIGKRESLSFSSKEFKDKLVSNPTCYLTGRKIDLLQPKTYQCDHIIPVSKGGTNDLDNLGLACKDANQSKTDLTHDEYIRICKEVLIHHGYSVIKMDS